MALSPELVNGLFLLGVAQTGALIFLLGRMTFMLANHDKRIDHLEQRSEAKK